jgi:putative transferase (TIGR04331 family)
MKKEYFLATTALENFWDPNKTILFLGEWCLDSNRKNYWQKLDGLHLENYLSDNKERDFACKDINKIYEQALPQIADILNTIHGTDHRLHYWRIVLGPWLHTYITSFYDRFKMISYALKEYPDLTTITLSPKSFVVPQDTNEFNRGLSSDLLNLQIFSKIFLYLKKDFPSKSLKFNLGDTFVSSPLSWKQHFFGSITNVYRFIVIRLIKNPVVISNSYFSKRTELYLITKFFGRIFSTLGMHSEYQLNDYDFDKREKLKQISLDNDDNFLKCLSSLIYSDIPKCFIEGYEELCLVGKKNYPPFPAAIFSSNSWWYDEIFKLWAAECSQNGIPLHGTPHGGGFGVRLYMPSLEHETKILDYYYSWGWNRENCNAEVISMPATKLMSISHIGASNSKSGVLWVTTASPRYVAFEFPFTSPESYRDYLSWHNRFVKSLSAKVLKVTSLRPHPQDYGWNVVDRIKEHSSIKIVDSSKVSFAESITSCRLYVCDHLSTTLTEALAANKPTILFWDPSLNKEHPDEEKYLESLRSKGILFNTPEAAAEAVDNVYDDVESWWNDLDRQKAINIFKERHCKSSPRASKIWFQELQKISISKNKDS